MTIALVLLTATGQALAGGGPENVLLLVNINSDSSKTIANHYVRMRRIAPANVLYIDWQGRLEECTSEQFRTSFLDPALDAIRERGLTNQIDYVVYSSDFPWRVRMGADFESTPLGKQFSPNGSLTGVTYLWQYLQTKNPGVVMPTTNWYVPRSKAVNHYQCQELGRTVSRAFRFRYMWNQSGMRVADVSQGQRYLLSTMLGVTTGRGNTVEEVLSYLRRSVWADGTQPRGTFYFMRSGGVRSSTRHDCFQEVATQLKLMGRQAEVLEGTLPDKRKDVLGLTTGQAKFDVEKSGCQILPGAICEHLTSSGGNLAAKADQTPLTEFLRHGAAGACGTVVEPYAIQAKFPLPSVHLHYARGCSLAEAFYQSVSGPYQLLIVGDPLCQPWARIPRVSVSGYDPEKKARGLVQLRGSTDDTTGQRIAFFEYYIDGVLRARLRPGDAANLETSTLADGYHELRVVAVVADPIEFCGRVVLPLEIDNNNVAMAFAVAPNGSVSADATLRLTAHQPGADGIKFLHNERVLGQTPGERGHIDVLAGMLGRGPVALRAVGEGSQAASSAPVWVRVE